MTESMKNRALNVFAALGEIPDGYVAAAEEALTKAEMGGRRALRPVGPVRRFLNSGLGAAVISGIVALTVLILIIRAGQEPPVHGPNQPPLGSSITIREEGADFTIATEEDYYPVNTNRITVIMTGVTPGKAISMTNAWYLEWLTDKGAKAVEIYYTEEAAISAKPARGQYATLEKTLHINDAKGYALQPGSYRLHATVYDGEEYVSVAWCEFTVGEVITEAEDFTIAARSPSYPKWTSNFSVILTSPTAEQDLALVASWYLERLTAEGPERIGTLSVNTAFETAKEANSIMIPLHIPITDLNSGLYRVHALGQDGDQLVSLASCTFTVEDDERVLNRFEFHPVNGAAPYTISVPDIPYGADSLTIIVTATEPGVPLIDPPLHWFIGKMSASHWPFDDDLDPWDASVTEIKEVLPSKEANGYAQLRVTLTFRYPPEWTPGRYYLYAMTEPLQEYNYLIDSCNFRVTPPAE